MIERDCPKYGKVHPIVCRQYCESAIRNGDRLCPECEAKKNPYKQQKQQ